MSNFVLLKSQTPILLKSYKVQVVIISSNYFQLVKPEVSKLSGFAHVSFCMERWSHSRAVGGQDLTHRYVYVCMMELIVLKLGQCILSISACRALYSIVVAVFQYLLPLLIVLIIYALIYKFLREQQYPRHLRQNKTNALLASISLTHCIIWLPFSVFNIMADLFPEKVRGQKSKTLFTFHEEGCYFCKQTSVTSMTQSCRVK